MIKVKAARLFFADTRLNAVNRGSSYNILILFKAIITGKYDSSYTIFTH
ncbi:MAG: hypothetical protein R6V27_14655 [Balneolaceae bacterium]